MVRSWLFESTVWERAGAANVSTRANALSDERLEGQKSATTKFLNQKQRTRDTYPGISG
jgi:hypothetical protein